MPLDFPNSPTGGQTYTSGGVVWSYDGQKWVNGSTGVGAGVSSFNTRTGAVTLASGDVTTALTYTPFNSTGVTNGSSAAAGQVGEYLETTAFAAPVSSGTGYTAATLALTAGDWDVGGNYQATFTTATGINTIGAVMQATGGTLRGAPCFWNAGFSLSGSLAWMGSLGVGRVSSATPITLSIAGQIGWTTASGIAVAGSLWARRNR